MRRYMAFIFLALMCGNAVAITQVILINEEKIFFEVRGNAAGQLGTATVVNAGSEPVLFSFDSGTRSGVEIAPGEQVIRTGDKLVIKRANSKGSRLNVVVVLETN